MCSTKKRFEGQMLLVLTVRVARVFSCGFFLRYCQIFAFFANDRYSPATVLLVQWCCVGVVCKKQQGDKKQQPKRNQFRDHSLGTRPPYLWINFKTIRNGHFLRKYRHLSLVLPSENGNASGNVVQHYNDLNSLVYYLYFLWRSGRKSPKIEFLK